MDCDFTKLSVSGVVEEIMVNVFSVEKFPSEFPEVVTPLDIPSGSEKLVAESGGTDETQSVLYSVVVTVDNAAFVEPSILVEVLVVNSVEVEL